MSEARGEQMSEQQTPVAAPAASSQDGGDLATQLAERTEDLQRVTAEYANYRRRVDRDRTLVADQAAERFAAQLFPIVDDIERARTTATWRARSRSWPTGSSDCSTGC